MRLLRNFGGWLQRLGPRRSAAILAFIISSAWFVPAFVVGVKGNTVLQGLAFAAAWIGPPMVTTTLVAAPLAKPAIRARSLDIPGFGTAVASIVLNAPIVAMEVALSFAEDLPSALSAAFFMTIFGLVVCGWLFLFIAIPSGYAWAWLLRRLFRYGPYGAGD